MEDFDNVLENNFSKEEQELIRKKFNEEQIYEILSRKFSIEWCLEIENAIKSFLLNNAREKNN